MSLETHSYIRRASTAQVRMSKVQENKALEACSVGNLSSLRELLLIDGTSSSKSLSTVPDILTQASRSEDSFQINTLLISQMLEKAAQNGHTYIIQFVLARYPKTELDETTVRRAAQRGSIDLYKVLLAHDPTIIDMNFHDGREYPITVALNLDKPPEFIEFHLSAGADPNVGFSAWIALH